MKKERPHNSGTWTSARFRAFITSALRAASQKWGPKIEVKRGARVDRGKYQCAGYECEPHIVTATLPANKPGGRRIDNALVDHIDPVVDPATGFVNWDTYINRLFVEKEGLQLLCRDCHDRKTAREKEQR